MSIAGGVFKRLLVGRPQRSDRLGESLLPKRIALPVFASDALSSVAYATEQILLVLSFGGLTLLHYIPEYVVGHWWEHLLHNQSALRLKGRLLFTPGVMVVSVPRQLESSIGVSDRLDMPPADGPAGA